MGHVGNIYLTETVKCYKSWPLTFHPTPTPIPRAVVRDAGLKPGILFLSPVILSPNHATHLTSIPRNCSETHRGVAD